MTTNVSRNDSRLAPHAVGANPSVPGWRFAGLGLLRIAFGIVWAIDAAFKWQPGFTDNFVSYVTGALKDQPVAVRAWIRLWVDVIQVDPRLFAHLVATSETALAIALIAGAFSNLAFFGGTSLALVIWSTAEGFGGPYKTGSTDIGTAIIYVLVFVGLFLAKAGLPLGIDRRLTPWLGRWGWIASGPLDATDPG
ncbi:MAG: hypothetical protein KGI57_05505 [Hyphomicrobiales bacterium]|nr:hypothetical protein [Hyphomicrobiales bacterium]MDE2017144.1 hypothetical protein [Hyphomicrobiales bacterium]